MRKLLFPFFCLLIMAAAVGCEIFPNDPAPINNNPVWDGIGARWDQRNWEDQGELVQDEAEEQ